MEIVVLILVFAVLFAVGVPIAFSIGAATICAFLLAVDFVPAVTTVAQRMAGGLNSFALLAIPLFILSGQLMAQGGIARRLIDFSKAFIGMFPGGLAFVNVISCMLFGSISGSAVAATSAIGGFMIPEMKRDGFDGNFSAALTATASSTGLVIPPSNILIIYAVASGGVSIAALFVAGYLPGLLMGIALMIVAAGYARKHNMPRGARVGLQEAARRTLAALPSLLLVVIVIGGILGGRYCGGLCADSSGVRLSRGKALRARGDSHQIDRNHGDRDVPDRHVNCDVVVTGLRKRASRVGEYSTRYYRQSTGFVSAHKPVSVGDWHFHGYDAGRVDLHANISSGCRRAGDVTAALRCNANHEPDDRSVHAPGWKHPVCQLCGSENEYRKHRAADGANVYRINCRPAFSDVHTGDQ